MSYKCFGAAVRFDYQDESIKDIDIYEDVSDVSEGELTTTDDESDSDIMEYTGYRCFGAARLEIKQTSFSAGGEVNAEYSYSTNSAPVGVHTTNGASAESSLHKEYTGYKCFGAAAKESVQSFYERQSSNSNTNNVSTFIYQEQAPSTRPDENMLGYKCFGQAIRFRYTDTDITCRNLSQLEATRQDRNTSPYLGIGCAMVTASIAGLLLYKYYF